MKKLLWLLMIASPALGQVFPPSGGGGGGSGFPITLGSTSVASGSTTTALAGLASINNVRYLSCASELGAQVTAAATSLGTTGGTIVFPNCTNATWTTATSQLKPNISFIGYGPRATQITCSVAGNCLNIHEPIDWASTSISIGSEISGFTMLGSAATGSGQVLIHGEGLNGFTIHDVALNGTDLSHEPTCMEFHNTTTDTTFTERNTTYDFQFGQECQTSVLFVQDGGDGNNSFGYNQFSFSVAPTGPNNAIVFNGNANLYGGSLSVYGNYVGTGGNILQFNNGFGTGSPPAGNTPLEKLFMSVENNQGDTTGHMISATGTNNLNFAGEVFNGAPGGALGFTTPFSIGGSATFNLSGEAGTQGSPSSGPLATDIQTGTASGSTVRFQECPNVTGTCQTIVGHDLGAGDQATVGFFYQGANSASSLGYVGTLAVVGYEWDKNGNGTIPTGSLTVGGTGFNPAGNIATFQGAWPFGTNFNFCNNSTGSNFCWGLISEGNGTGITNAFGLSNGTSWPLTVYDNNSAAPWVAMLSNSSLAWSTASSGTPSSTAQNAGISSSGSGVVNCDSTTAGNHSCALNVGKINVLAARKGTFVCTAAGTITIANANETATSDVIISLNTAGGTISTSPAMKTVTAGTGFTVLCGAADTSTYNYDILN